MLAGTLILGFRFKAETSVAPARVRLLLFPSLSVRIGCLPICVPARSISKIALNFSVNRNTTQIEINGINTRDTRPTKWDTAWTPQQENSVSEVRAYCLEY
jgi:hypothetical protein